MPGLIVEKSAPFALFRFENGVVEMSESEFREAVSAAQKCGCGDCMDCRALEYSIETDSPLAPIKG